MGAKCRVCFAFSAVPLFLRADFVPVNSQMRLGIGDLRVGGSDFSFYIPEGDRVVHSPVAGRATTVFIRVIPRLPRF